MIRIRSKYFILIFLEILGIGSIILSYFIFGGLFSSTWTFCGDPGRIWPGIQKPGIYPPVCVDRSYLYIVFFILGLLVIILTPLFVTFCKKRPQ
ncbi:MAG: hypothetical protein JW776_05680 [Candidatus Lokiarchaeota archaeon]|nr:hypothetical protein [Candidatus Lokiarchaeota archaeon]